MSVHAQSTGKVMITKISGGLETSRETVSLNVVRMTRGDFHTHTHTHTPTHNETFYDNS